MARTFSRRELLGNAGRYGLGALAVGSLADPARLARVLAEQRAAKAARPMSSSPTPGPLVLATMYGGYDGINLVAPYQNSGYLAARPSMNINANALALNVTTAAGDALGLHPTCLGINSLWQQNNTGAANVAIIQGVGMPNPNYSHFSSMAQWMAGSEDLTVLSGWAGRWLDGAWSGSNPELLALSVGAGIPQLLTGNSQVASGVSDTDVAANQSVTGGSQFQAALGFAQDTSAYTNPLEIAVASSGEYLIDVATEASSALTVSPKLSFPRNAGDFGQQLEIIAQLIRAGSPTQVYQASMGGFDTHSAEVAGQNSLFSQMDSAVSAFFTYLGSDSAAAGTILVIYTEFGRQFKENGSSGTDHGNGNMMLVIGQSVKGGLYGTYPSLTSLDGAGALDYQVDFRSVEATLIDNVLGANSSTILGEVNNGNSFPDIANLIS